MIRVFNFNQKFYIRIPILVSIIFLSLISISILKSAGSFESEIFGILFSRDQKQILWIIIGIFLFVIVQFVRLRYFHEKMFLLYFIFIFIIILPFFSDATKGAQNWFYGFQPSEIGKIIIVISLAKILSDNKKYINNVLFLFICMLLLIIPVLIFIIQKDLGAALVYSFIFIPMIYWSGVKPFIIFFLISPISTVYTNLYMNIYELNPEYGGYSYILLSLFLILNFIFLIKFFSNSKESYRYKFFFVSSYIILNLFFLFISTFSWDYLVQTQDTSNRSRDLKGRIENFIIPSLGENAGGWHIKQSMVAVGSGGVFGVGLGKGTQVNLRFLPEADTDFIIASIAEALGFVFILIIIGLYFNLLYWLIFYAQRLSSEFLSLLIIGYSSIIFAHMIITLGMAVALAPITGIPAPFLSYGGTFTLTCFVMLGICNNASNNN
jgi:rod shape determining protein RodA